MPKPFSVSERKIVESWIDGSFNEFIETVLPGNVLQHAALIKKKRLLVMKQLCLAEDPAAFILQNKIFSDLEGVYSFLSAFLNPVRNLLLAQDIHPKYNLQVIFAARVKLCYLVIKKMRELSCVDREWVREAQGKLEEDYANLIKITPPWVGSWNFFWLYAGIASIDTLFLFAAHYHIDATASEALEQWSPHWSFVPLDAACLIPAVGASMYFYPRAVKTPLSLDDVNLQALAEDNRLSF